MTATRPIYDLDEAQRAARRRRRRGLNELELYLEDKCAVIREPRQEQTYDKRLRGCTSFSLAQQDDVILAADKILVEAFRRIFERREAHWIGPNGTDEDPILGVSIESYFSRSGRKKWRTLNPSNWHQRDVIYFIDLCSDAGDSDLFIRDSEFLKTTDFRWQDVYCALRRNDSRDVSLIINVYKPSYMRYVRQVSEAMMYNLAGRRFPKAVGSAPSERTAIGELKEAGGSKPSNKHEAHNLTVHTSSSSSPCSAVDPSKQNDKNPRSPEAEDPPPAMEFP
ncbi:hypothetical protein HK097_006504, partial [Rhizophlyctis rosea]